LPSKDGVISARHDLFVHRLIHLDVVPTRGTVWTMLHMAKSIVCVTKKTLDIGVTSVIMHDGAVSMVDIPLSW